MSRISLTLAFLLTCLLASETLAAKRADGQLRIEVVDSETGQPIAARMHLRNSRGRPVKLRLPGVAFYKNHFYIDGKQTLPLRKGQYRFELESGPEYRTRSGHFEIVRHADDTKRIEMHRFANLAEEGWWAGDLDVERQLSPKPRSLILRAEGLQEVLLGDSRPRDQSAVARLPFDWDLPLRIADEASGTANLDALLLIHRHSLRNGVVDNEGEGRPRDRALFPGKDGNGRWSETIYYHLLESGLRIPPAAGSGSGTNGNPLGTNRVYVYCGKEFSQARWWAGLQAGRVFVTNGPLLRPSVRGQAPGYVFSLYEGEALTLEIGLKLATRVPVEYLEIIKNGQLEAEVRLSEWAKTGGRLPPVHFKESGWFLIRAITNHPKKYQFASSGPYYVEKEGEPRICRRSTQFFLDWIDERAQQKGRTDDTTARRFWQDLHDRANAE